MDDRKALDDHYKVGQIYQIQTNVSRMQAQLTNREKETNRLTRGMVSPKTFVIKRVKAASRNEKNIYQKYFECVDGYGRPALRSTNTRGWPIY